MGKLFKEGHGFERILGDPMAAAAAPSLSPLRVVPPWEAVVPGERASSRVNDSSDGCTAKLARSSLKEIYSIIKGKG